MFFKQFPKVEYDFNRTGIKQNMVDLFRSVRPLPSFLDNFFPQPEEISLLSKILTGI